MYERTYDTSSGAYSELNLVFSQTFTTPLPADEEQQLAGSLWKRRRRLQLALIWRDRPESFHGLPPDIPTHRAAIPGVLMKRWLDAERRARNLVTHRSDSSALASWMTEELSAIDREREQLFNRNLRLLAWVARGFRGKGLDLADLFQEGSIALLNAVERFDPARGVRLGTFASHAIRLGLVRALAERGRTIRIPNYRIREIIDAGKARATLVNRLEREPHVDEIAKECGLPADAIEEILPALRPLLSMDAPIAGSELPLSDVATDRFQPSQYDRVLTAETRSRAGKALARLPERERCIVSMRYGLVDDEEHTYEEIGQTLGLSRERARQLERSAREKLRTSLQSVACG